MSSPGPTRGGPTRPAGRHSTGRIDLRRCSRRGLPELLTSVSCVVTRNASASGRQNNGAESFDCEGCVGDFGRMFEATSGRGATGFRGGSLVLGSPSADTVERPVRAAVARPPVSIASRAPAYRIPSAKARLRGQDRLRSRIRSSGETLPLSRSFTFMRCFSALVFGLLLVLVPARLASAHPGRLTTAVVAARHVGKIDRAFQYDPAGSLVNVLERADRGALADAKPWKVGPGNVLLETPTRKYVNDKRGRRTGERDLTVTEGQERITEYTWDVRDRMREARLPDGKRVVYDYDALGRRIGKRVFEGASPTPRALDGLHLERPRPRQRALERPCCPQLRAPPRHLRAAIAGRARRGVLHRARPGRRAARAARRGRARRLERPLLPRGAPSRRNTSIPTACRAARPSPRHSGCSARSTTKRRGSRGRGSGPGTRRRVGG